MSRPRHATVPPTRFPMLLGLALLLGCGQGSGGGGGTPGTEAGAQADAQADAQGSGEAASCIPMGSVCGTSELCCQGSCSVDTGQTQATCQ
jgi:hypothetical protein